MSQEDYPEEIRTYAKSGCPFNTSDRRKYNHWYHYKVRKLRLANKILESKK
jgi:hypothetical protein